MAGRAGGERDLHGARDAGTGDDQDGQRARPRRRQQRPRGDRPGPDGGARRRRRARGARRPVACGAGFGRLGARPAWGRAGRPAAARRTRCSPVRSRPAWRSSSARPRPARATSSRRRCRSRATSSRSPPTDATLAVPFDCALAAISRDGDGREPLRRVRRADRAGARGRAGADPDADAGGVARAGDDPAARPGTDHRHRTARAGVQAGQAHGLAERRADDDPPQPHDDAQAQRHQRRLQALEQGQDQRRQGARAVRPPGGDAVGAQARPEAHHQAAREADREGQGVHEPQGHGPLRQVEGLKRLAAADRQGAHGQPHAVAQEEPDRRHVLVAQRQPRRLGVGQPRAVLRRRRLGLQRLPQGRPADDLHDPGRRARRRVRHPRGLPAVHLRREDRRGHDRRQDRHASRTASSRSTARSTRRP